jgi:hypothetical protein
MSFPAASPLEQDSRDSRSHAFSPEQGRCPPRRFDLLSAEGAHPSIDAAITARGRSDRGESVGGGAEVGRDRAGP